MQPSNNIFIGGGDPLLGSSANYGSIESRMAELDALESQLGKKMQQLQQLKQELPKENNQQMVSQTPVWDEIDSIIQALGDKEFEFISNNQEFIDSSEKIATILQQAYMQMMRPIVERSQAGKDALEAHLTLVKRLRKSATNEINKEISEFQEYTEKYSNIPYTEYLKMKKQPKGGKK